MAKRVAVITDATSPGYWFPVWHRYYAKAFGAQSLYVVTYSGLKKEFAWMTLGGLWEVPHRYDDALRAKVLSSLVSTLLLTHDVVLRCDVDEFIFPDPRVYSSLRDYVEKLTAKYVTALGIDVFERLGEAPLDLSRPILEAQRRFGVVSSAVHKTCLTTVPANWGLGFHGCGLFPSFHDLFLLHMKFADVSRRVEWHGHMLDNAVKGGREEIYYSDALAKLKMHQEWLSKKPCRDGWEALDDKESRQRFIESVQYKRLYDQHDFYQGKFTTGDSIFSMPADFIGL